MFRILGMIFTGLLVLFGIGVFWGLQSSGSERDLVRAFIDHLSDRDFAAMHAMLHPSVNNEVSPGFFRSQLGQVAVYEEVSFLRFEISGSETTVGGVATTASGCASQLTFTFVGDLITAFNIAGLCQDPTRPALEEAV